MILFQIRIKTHLYHNNSKKAAVTGSGKALDSQMTNPYLTRANAKEGHLGHLSPENLARNRYRESLGTSAPCAPNTKNRHASNQRKATMSSNLNKRFSKTMHNLQDTAPNSYQAVLAKFEQLKTEAGTWRRIAQEAEARLAMYDAREANK